MKKVTTSIWILLTLVIVLFISTTTFLSLWIAKGQSDKIDTEIDEIERFDYIEPTYYNPSEIIDFSKGMSSFSLNDIHNFNESEMKLFNVTYGAYSGISTTFFDFGDLSSIGNYENVALLTPYYVDGKLDSLISGRKDYDNNPYVANWFDDEMLRYQSNAKNFDHEMIKYKGKNYILNGSRIWIQEANNEEVFLFRSDDDLGLPPTTDANGDRIASPAGYHFNSFDIYGENIVINSRDYGTIFSLNILNNDGSLKEEDDWSLNWVLCGNSIAPYYIDSNYNEDGTWENPILFNGGTETATYYNYDENPDYEPELFNEWEGKMLKIEIDGIQYDFEDIAQAKAFNELDNDHKFFGAHTVRVINKYLDSVSDSIDGYDESKLYISIHDNHFPSDVVYKYDDPEMHGVDWGDDPYSYHAYTDKTKSIFGDNPYSLMDDTESFTKVYEIDSETMVAKEVLNRSNNVSDDVNQFSDYRSSSTFFSINGQSYLVTESSMNSSFALVAFDGYDSDTNSLVNERTIMEVQWTGEAGGYMHYRTYPIFGNVENVAYGWNAINEDSYMG